MKKEIKLNSRYGDKNILVQVDGSDHQYTLNAEYPYREGSTDGERKFIDPSGGPMMVEGTYLPEANAYIESIENGVITFKE